MTIDSMKLIEHAVGFEFYFNLAHDPVWEEFIALLTDYIKQVEGINMEANFIEVETVEQANFIDMKVWKFITYDSGKYVFARRIKPLVK